MMGKIFKRLMACALLILSVTLSFAEEPANSAKEYKGPLYNIFFHPLIAYPKLAFTPANTTHLEYIDSWFVTTHEFNKILPELYQKGFVLVSPKDVFEEKKDNHGYVTLVRKKIMLPQGKKPLILSLDDYNFYKNMKLYGTVHQFWVNPKGQLATVSYRDGKKIIRYDQEIPQILEAFIAQHPDFSFNSARGIQPTFLILSVRPKSAK